MNDPQPAQNLQPLKDTALIASSALQDQYNLYNSARSAGDLSALTAHYQGYQTALQVQQKANEVLTQALLNTPALANDLNMLNQANQQLSNEANNLKNDTAALNAFTQAAGTILAVLGAVAML